MGEAEEDSGNPFLTWIEKWSSMNMTKDIYIYIYSGLALLLYCIFFNQVFVCVILMIL